MRWAWLAGMAMAAAPAWGQALVEGGRLSDRWWGGAELELRLEGAAPWRARVEGAPPRLVVEIEDAALAGTVAVEGEAAGPVAWSEAEGWGRLEVALAAPMRIAEAGLGPREGGATLRVVLEPAEAMPGPDSASEAAPATDAAPGGALVVAVDPGHGGVDPGAERDGLEESDLMLALAAEVAAALRAAGFEAVLTRTDDSFVPLPERLTRARAAGADVLVSLHADALEEASAQGASVYTLAPGAADAASRRMQERHGGGDLIAGLDLGGQDSGVTGALLALARGRTAPESARLAARVVEGLQGAGAAVNGRPLREAELAVLAAADFPGVLVETGFLSDAGDRARLSTPAGRASLVAGLVAGLRAWAEGR